MPAERRAIITVLERFGSLLALIILVVIGCLFSHAFRDPVNIQNILRNAAPVGIVAIGMTFVITLGGIDLSVGSAAALLGVASIVAMNSFSGDGQPGWSSVGLGALVCCGGGLLLGAFNGAMIAFGRFAPFIASLATMAAYKSIAQTVANDGTVSAKGDLFSILGTSGIPLIKEGTRVSLMLPYPVVAFVVVALVGQFLLKRTTYGLNVRAIGGNEVAAKYGGIGIRGVVLLTYALCGLTAGLGSLMTTSYLNSASHVDTGRLWELDAIAAVVIGGTRMSGGFGSIGGTVVGVVMLGVIDNLVVIFDVPPSLQGLIKGGIIIAAVLLQRGKK